MANITINDLQPAEFAELSDLELEAIVGGKISLREFGRRIDRAVRQNVPGGWVGVVKTGVQLYTGGAFAAL
jgi:hypothetical protein